MLAMTMFFAAAKDISLKPLSLVFPCRLRFATVANDYFYVGSGAFFIKAIQLFIEGFFGHVIFILCWGVGTDEVYIEIFSLNTDCGKSFIGCSESRDMLTKSLSNFKAAPHS